MAGWLVIRRVGEDDDQVEDDNQVVVQAGGPDRWHGGGLLAGLIFKRVWTLIGRGGAPKPTDERRG
jgi:hypothetical protein